MSQQKNTTQMEEEMNFDIYSRNVPSSMLQPYINVRPVSTKYSIMPVVDPRRELNYPLRVDPTYCMRSTFNPGNATAPWSGYASKVNVESELKNQIFALQHCDRSEFVPSSSSDLYRAAPCGTSKPVQMNHPLLFEKQTFSDCPRVPPYLHQTLFNTPTREETRMAGIKKD